MRIWELSRLKKWSSRVGNTWDDNHNTHLQAIGKNKTYLICLHKRNYQILCFFLDTLLYRIIKPKKL